MSETMKLTAGQRAILDGERGETSFMIIPSGAMAIAITWFLYRRERKSSNP